MIKVFQHGNDKDTVIKLEGSNQVIALEMIILIKEVSRQFPEIMQVVADELVKKEVAEHKILREAFHSGNSHVDFNKTQNI